MNIENIIREKIQIPISDDLSVYKSMDNKLKYTDEIVKIVNEVVPKINSPYDDKVLEEIKENGYCVVENFLSQEQVDQIVKFTEDIKGYQFHVPGRAYNTVPEKFSEESSWNVCSYKMNQIFKNHAILDLMTRKDIVSLAQAYLGCLPTITAVNLWWSKYNGELFHTQNIHRDYDDFKFLAFFVYLSDVDDSNGPHVYYRKTHNGSDDMSEKVTITGKAGTAIFGDTYALHHGEPLKSGKRLMFWVRYSLHKNNNFYRNNDQEYVLQPNMFFDVIDDTVTNRHLLNAFTALSE
jgi:hypothetical protein